jgi:ketosteroid isomerase-like protein
MISRTQAQQFASDWIAAWNSHDLDLILSHYTDDFEMSSPKIITLMNEPSGRLRGKSAVRSYWKHALELRPDLHFRFLEVFAGVDTICLRYESLDGTDALEWLQTG